MQAPYLIRWGERSKQIDALVNERQDRLKVRVPRTHLLDLNQT